MVAVEGSSVDTDCEMLHPCRFQDRLMGLLVLNCPSLRMGSSAVVANAVAPAADVSAAADIVVAAMRS